MARAVAEEPEFIGLAGVAGYYAHTTPESRRADQARIDRGLAAERSWHETGMTQTIPAVAAEGGDVARGVRVLRNTARRRRQLCQRVRRPILGLYDPI